MSNNVIASDDVILFTLETQCLQDFHEFILFSDEKLIQTECHPGSIRDLHQVIEQQEVVSAKLR